MEWSLPLVGMLLLMLLVVPPAVLVSTLLLLWLSGHFVPAGPTVARTSFDCPFSKRRASVEFLIAPGSDRPSDVLSCSVFAKPYHVRCKKGCLELADAGWAPSPMMPRYALLADGVALRPVGARQGPGPDPDGGPSRQGTRAA
jgi:hypothetical protein